jgi:hypothetical protein
MAKLLAELGEQHDGTGFAQAFEELCVIMDGRWDQVNTVQKYNGYRCNSICKDLCAEGMCRGGWRRVRGFDGQSR